MKVKNKLIVGLLTLNLALGGGLAAGISQNEAYAAEANLANFEKQRAQLQKAIDDVPNVLASEIYTSYASQELKADYEAAVDYASLVLGKENEATVKELVDATANINKAKSEIYKAAENLIQKQKLLKAIENNEKIANTAQFLMDNYPETVKKVRTELEAMVKTSRALVQQARQLYNSL